MTLLSVGGLTKYYGAELIFENLNFQVARGDKVALVGVNGAGKSTLLKIIAGLERPDGGQATIARGARIAYLSQEVRFGGERTLWQEMERALATLRELEVEIQALEPVIADTAAPGWEAAMERYGELSARFEHLGGYEVEPRIKRTLQGLEFHESQYTSAWPTSPAARRPALPSPLRCSPTPTCCCSMSRPTISTCRPWSGSNTSSAPGMAR